MDLEKNIEIKEQKKQLFINEEKLKTNDTIKEKQSYQDIEKMNEFIGNSSSTFKQNFELLKYVSSGSVGIFYEGRSKKCPSQKLGMKFLISTKEEQKKGKKILREKNEEMLILKKLHHKNIISLYGNYKLNDYNSVAILELAKFGDLDNFQRTFLKRKYLSETMINFLSKQILDGLEYIHENKIIHLDIKQDNILIDSCLNAKITDFSISASYKEFNSNEKIRLPFAGTRKYMSPEILGRKSIKIGDCSKVDMYSLGVVLYYLAFGKYPYDLNSVHGKNYDEIERKIKVEKLEFPDEIEVSELFKDFLRGLLEKDIHKRLNIKKALEHQWIKGANIINDEKDKMNCLDKFLILLITDSIPDFNDYLEKYSKINQMMAIEESLGKNR